MVNSHERTEGAQPASLFGCGSLICGESNSRPTGLSVQTGKRADRLLVVQPDDYEGKMLVHLETLFAGVPRDQLNLGIGKPLCGQPSEYLVPKKGVGVPARRSRRAHGSGPRSARSAWRYSVCNAAIRTRSGCLDGRPGTPSELGQRIQETECSDPSSPCLGR